MGIGRIVPNPAGEFPADDPKNQPSQHLAKISKPFHLGAFEVTQGQYEKVMGKNPSNDTGVNKPVEQVSWEDAVEFCRRLSAKPKEKAAGRAYRLPTEAEWEYACRAGSTTMFGFGDDPTKLRAYAWTGSGYTPPQAAKCRVQSVREWSNVSPTTTSDESP